MAKLRPPLQRVDRRVRFQFLKTHLKGVQFERQKGAKVHSVMTSFNSVLNKQSQGKCNAGA